MSPSMPGSSAEEISDEHLTNLEVAGLAVSDFAQRLHIGLTSAIPPGWR